MNLNFTDKKYFRYTSFFSFLLSHSGQSQSIDQNTKLPLTIIENTHRQRKKHPALAGDKILPGMTETITLYT